MDFADLGPAMAQSEARRSVEKAEETIGNLLRTIEVMQAQLNQLIEIAMAQDKRIKRLEKANTSKILSVCS